MILQTKDTIDPFFFFVPWQVMAIEIDSIATEVLLSWLCFNRELNTFFSLWTLESLQSYNSSAASSQGYASWLHVTASVPQSLNQSKGKTIPEDVVSSVLVDFLCWVRRRKSKKGREGKGGNAKREGGQFACSLLIGKVLWSTEFTLACCQRLFSICYAVIGTTLKSRPLWGHLKNKSSSVLQVTENARWRILKTKIDIFGYFLEFQAQKVGIIE